MIDTPTSPEMTKGNGKQLSNKELQEMVRAHIPKAIQTLVALLDSPNDNARAGAAKVIMAKVLPDLKAVELTGEDGKAIKIDITGMLQKVYGLTPIKPAGDLPKNS